jgi:2-succinyl-6-hydroxy-2,4-cyclohexadiene-1-carboxylate synthase
VRVVLVPGFTQTADSWRDVRDVVQEVADVHALNVPLRDSFPETADAIGEEGGRAIYVGYSMGGRLCLQLALDHPELVAGLVLVSATAGLADPQERAARVDADEKLAREIERDGVDAFVKRWLDQPLFATVPPDAPGLAQRATLPAAYLTGCLRVLGTGAMPTLWNRLGELRMPVALVTGRDDAKFDRLAGMMLERMCTDVQHVRIDGGHAVPLEQPEVLGGFLVAFVAQHSTA